MNIKYYILIILIITACSKENLKPLPSDKVISVSSLNITGTTSTLFSEIEITVKVDPKTDPKHYPFTMQASLGSFNEQSSTVKSIEFTPDANGLFKTTLFTGYQTGQSVVTVKTKDAGYSVTHTIQFNAIPIDSIFSVVIAPSDSIEANGSSSANIAVHLNPAYDFTGKKISFKSTAGTFSENEITITATSKTLYTQLRSTNDVQTVRLEVVISDYPFSIELPFKFYKAYPNSMYLQASGDSIAQNTPYVLTANLYTSIGKVSKQSEVLFSATDSSGIQIGTFYNILPSNADGIANATFILRDSNYKGVITFRARTSSSAISMINDQINVPVKK